VRKRLLHIKNRLLEGEFEHNDNSELPVQDIYDQTKVERPVISKSLAFFNRGGDGGESDSTGNTTKHELVKKGKG
jgi:hypothetical protein